MQGRIIFFLLIICIGATITVGCTSTGSNNATAQAITVPSPSTMAITPTQTVTPTLTPTSVPSTPPVGWEVISVPEDNFNIDIPSGWTHTESDTNSEFFLNEVSIPNVKITPMAKVLYVTSPDSNIVGIITNVEILNNDGTTVSNATLPLFLNGCIPAIEQGMKGGTTTQEFNGVQYTNIETGGIDFSPAVDPIVYSDNGHNAMHAYINVANSNGQYVVYDWIVVKQIGNQIYFSQFSFINNEASVPDATVLVGYIQSTITPIQ